MFKKALVAVAILMLCPAFVFSQDFFFLFGGDLPEAGATPATNTFNSTASSGSVNIYSASGVDFDAIDLDFFSSDPGVAQITGGEAFNPTFNVVGSDRFDFGDVTADPGGASGTLFAVNLTMNGINQAIGSLFDPLFDSAIGPDGAFLLGRVDFDIVGAGTSEFSFAVGDLSIIELPDVDIGLTATFGNATISTIPEPSSAIVLILGCVGMVARRKRA